MVLRRKFGTQIDHSHPQPMHGEPSLRHAVSPSQTGWSSDIERTPEVRALRFEGRLADCSTCVGRKIRHPQC